MLLYATNGSCMVGTAAGCIDAVSSNRMGPAEVKSTVGLYPTTLSKPSLLLAGKLLGGKFELPHHQRAFHSRFKNLIVAFLKRDLWQDRNTIAADSYSCNDQLELLN